MTSIAVLPESELKNGEMKEVKFGDGAVLVSRLGDKVHATSAYCTHYGAPLAKGVLNSSGRVVCPWHGACFNVRSGDIEDAPGLDAIHCFKTEISDGNIVVTADPKLTLKDNKARKPTITKSSSASQGAHGVVIVGGGAGAINTYESLREHGYAGPITVITEEAYAPIDRTKLSKGLIGDPAKVEWRPASVLSETFGVNLKIKTSVTSCDFKNKTVTTSSGDSVPYDALVLATGGKPRRLPVEGANLSNVFTLRHVEDAGKISQACQEGKRLVVIGSSFIGMEIAGAVASRNLASTDVIAMEEFPFENILGPVVGKGMKAYYTSKGINFHPKTKVSKIVASTSDPNLAASVEIDGKSLPADVVVMGVGVAPATEYLKGSGITLEKDGGVAVDEFLLVKGLSDVYAIGDIAYFPIKAAGVVGRIEHWNVASNHGRAVGKTISGSKQPFVKVPIFWSSQGLRYCGYGVGFDDVVVNGTPGEKFVAYYAKGDKVIAVASMQRDPIVSHSAELLRLGLMPDVASLKSGKDPLSIAVTES